MRLRVLPAIIVATLAGCGGDDPEAGFPPREQAVVDTVEAYEEAAERGDAATVCGRILSRETTAPLGRTCPATVREQLRRIGDTSLEVVAVRFRDETAIATVVTGDGDPPRSGDLALVQEGGRWRIARVGPLP